MPICASRRALLPKDEIYCGDNLQILKKITVNSISAIITDPPYALVEPRSGGNFYHRPRTEEEKLQRRGGFMGKSWDGALPDPQTWVECFRVLEPSGYMLCFGGSRTYHRLVCHIEDAGFEVRDCLMWLYCTGFPKSKACLKPAYEPIVLVRKPGPKMKPLGIDSCRVGTTRGKVYVNSEKFKYWKEHDGCPRNPSLIKDLDPNKGRYPPNVLHDGSEEVINDLPYSNRFFYCAKPTKSERGSYNTHPTVKPLKLLEWLVRLVSKDGDTVLDPFMGSGTTLVACKNLQRHYLGIDQDSGYCRIAEQRLQNDPTSL